MVVQRILPFALAAFCLAMSRKKAVLWLSVNGSRQALEPRLRRSILSDVAHAVHSKKAPCTRPCASGYWRAQKRQMCSAGDAMSFSNCASVCKRYGSAYPMLEPPQKDEENVNHACACGAIASLSTNHGK